MDGSERQRVAERKSLVDQAVRLPYSDPAENHRVAADAEVWFLDHYGLGHTVKHDGPNTCDYRLGDAHLDVKSTPLPHGKLLRHKSTRAETHWCTAYVLVTGTPGAWKLRGWTTGAELKLHWDATLPRPAWAMPQSALNRGDTDRMMMKYFNVVRVGTLGL